jgi:signal peptidase I
MEEPTKEHQEEPVSKTQFVVNVVWDLVITILPALLVALFINVFVAEAALVEYGPSMEPNLYRGYRVMTEKVSYFLHPPRRGDVVVADRPGNEVSLIKRVVALPGETVEVRGGHTFINGERIEEPWVTHFGGPSYPPTVVPPDHVFILGDNRSASRDSRSIGPVAVDSIKGRVWFVYWPLDQIKLMP